MWNRLSLSNVAVQYNEISDVVKGAIGADDNAIDLFRATSTLISTTIRT